MRIIQCLFMPICAQTGTNILHPVIGKDDVSWFDKLTMREMEGLQGAEARHCLWFSLQLLTLPHGELVEPRTMFMPIAAKPSRPSEMV
jgi:hypothetical protein